MYIKYYNVIKLNRKHFFSVMYRNISDQWRINLKTMAWGIEREAQVVSN